MMSAFQQVSPSPESHLFQSLALLSASAGPAYNHQLASLASVVCASAPSVHDGALLRTNIASVAVYHSRSSKRDRPEAGRLLDALARRCMQGPFRNALCSSLASAVRADRTFQLQLACSGDMKTPIGRFTGAAAADAFHALELPLTRLVDIIDTVESEPPASAGHNEEKSKVPIPTVPKQKVKPQYRMCEVDALFFEALDADSELLHRVWDKQATPSTTDRLRVWARGGAEPYHELMLTRLASGGGLATRMANAVAFCDSAADSVVRHQDGLAALRLLAETPPDEARDNASRLAFFQTEVARAAANVTAGVADIHSAACEAIDKGLVALLGEWAVSSAAAGGHLQAESWRALHNLHEAIVVPMLAEEHAVSGSEAPIAVARALSARRRYANGLLPLTAPRQRCNELSGRQNGGNLVAKRREVDVVCVHGLRGSPLLTWRHTSHRNGSAGPDKSETSEDGGTLVWPRDWLARDAPFTRVVSAGHDAGVLRKGVAEKEQTLAQRAAQLRRALRCAGVGEGRNVVFVTHSYGGLIVKEALANDPELWKATKALVFFATPHAGSPAAHPVPVFSQAVRELTEADRALRELHDSFIEAVRKRSDVTVLSFGEALAYTAGRQSLGLLVPAESADPGVGTFFIVEGADHVGVCKPGRRDDWRYRRVVDVVIAAVRKEDVENS